MICNNCKKEISETAMFCPNCGAANEQINNVENKIEEQAIINHPFNEIEQNIAVDNTINSNTQNNVIDQQENYFEGQNIINHPFNETKQNTVIFPNMDNNNLDQIEQQTTSNSEFNNNNINGVVNNNLNQPITNNPTFNNNEQINTTTQEHAEEKVNVALAILSWFIPLVGIIIFFTQKDKKPKTAKICGIVALIDIAILFIFTTISIAVLFSVKNNSYVKSENTTTTTSYNFTTTTTKKDDKSNNLTSIANWKNYDFSIDGHKLKLPCSYYDLEKIYNFKIEDKYLNYSLEPNYYTAVSIYYNNKSSLYVDIYNDTNNEIKLSEGKIKRINQVDYQKSNSNISITFPGNLSVGMEITKDELINLLGTPSDSKTRKDGNYYTETYKYTEDSFDTSRNYYEIRLTNGIISELTLDNINY